MKGRREKEREKKRKGKEEEGKEKGKGEREREIGSEPLAETEKIANAPADDIPLSHRDKRCHQPVCLKFYPLCLHFTTSAPAKCRKVVSIKSYAATKGRPRTHQTTG